MNKTYYLECDCSDHNHLVKFTYSDKDDYDSGSIYISIQMNQWQPWYKRLILAIGYLFGKESKFGHWDCTILEYSKMKELNKFLGECIVECEREKNYN